MKQNAVVKYVDIVINVDVFNAARLKRLAKMRHLDASSLASFFVTEGCTTGIKRNKNPALFLAQKVVQPPKGK